MVSKQASKSAPASIPAKKTYEELAEQWGDNILIDLLDGLEYKAKTEYSPDDPELLALQAVHTIMAKDKLSVAHAIAVHQGTPIPTDDAKQNAKSSQNGKPPESSEAPSAPAQLLQLQKTDAELMQQATALELLNIAKMSRFQGLARQAFVQGRRPKDETLGKLYDLAEQEVRRCQQTNPYQIPFFIQGEDGDPETLTIEMLAFDSTLPLADPTKPDAESLLELIFEPAKPPEALLEGSPTQLKLTAA
jgi:hypothetical protein